jgi:hypothetical protein
MPKRLIQGQATKLGRSVHNIRYDPVHDEIIGAHPVAQAILVFRGAADGNEAPIRTIMGPKTQLWDPDYVGVDGVHNEIYVSSGEKVLVFDQRANGDVAPLRIIEGPDTMLGRMRGAPQVVPELNLMVVAAGNIPGKPGNGKLLIFNRTDNGNVKPMRVISLGPRAGYYGGDFVVSPKGFILIPGTNNEGRGGRGGGGGEEGGEGGGGERGQPNRILKIWSVYDNGDVPPRWIFGGPMSKLAGGNVALNPKLKEIIVHTGDENGMSGYSLPEIF